MLKSIPTETSHLRVFRLASQSSLSEFLQAQGVDELGAYEIRMLLQSRGMGDSPEELCDAPFRPKPMLRKSGHRTRFSDGSFLVFYSSLDPETTEAEIRHWFPTIVGRPTQQRTAYFSRFACDFNGTTKDLRSKKNKWPKLLHNSDYQFCNRLGSEAVQLGLDGLLTPSARRKSGTNLPVFTRKSISNPGESVLLAITYDPATENVSFSIV